MHPKLPAKRHRELKDKWSKSAYYSRDPSHPRAHLNLRLRRSLSWLDRAEREGRDYDASFVFYWIAFNAAYGKQKSPWHDLIKEKELIHEYLQRIIAEDWNAVKKAIWPHLATPIKQLIDNEHVFYRSWESQNMEPDIHQDWKRKFEKDKRDVKEALHQRTKALWRTAQCILFDRLYTLRNQLLHGGATYAGSVNREQVEDGARIMVSLMPCFIEVMIDHPETNWGVPRFPVRVDQFTRPPR